MRELTDGVGKLLGALGDLAQAHVAATLAEAQRAVAEELAEVQGAPQDSEPVTDGRLVTITEGKLRSAILSAAQPMVGFTVAAGVAEMVIARVLSD